MLPFRWRSAGMFATALLVAPLSAFAVSPRPPATPLVAQSIHATAANSITNVATERKLRLQWRGLFDNHAWATLDAIANRLRSRRLRFQGGGWQLHVIYTILSTTRSNTPTDAAWETQIAGLREWMRRDPSSPTPRIALADAYENFAWKARGNGLAHTVAPEGWNLFKERIQQAREVLEQEGKMGHDDPEWYDAMLTVASAQGWNRAQTDALADEALKKEPEYFYPARLMADYLLPKWYGQPGDTEDFAEKIADRIGGTQGDATYFLVAEYILIIERCDCRNSRAAMSWPRIRKGYAAVERLYGTNNFEHNALAFLALRVADDRTARQAFEEIGDNWDKDVWGSKAFFDDCRLHTLQSFGPTRMAVQK
ncbi:MAG: hypothetical protein WBD10_02760 [Acidobacteriaceae bacterium]